MREYLKILLVGLALSVAGTVLAVQAAEAATVQVRAQQAKPAGVTENAPVAISAAWPSEICPANPVRSISDSAPIAASHT